MEDRRAIGDCMLLAAKSAFLELPNPTGIPNFSFLNLIGKTPKLAFMCDNRHFKLCTCAEVDWENLDENTLVWVFRQHVGTTSRRGIAMRPKKVIGGKLTSKWFESALNESNPFDFEYIPQELDALTVYFPAPKTEDTQMRGYHESMAFLYADGAWIRDRRLSPKHKYELHGKGKVEFANGHIPAEAAPPPPETRTEFMDRLAASGARLDALILTESELPAPQMFSTEDVIWKISRYKTRSRIPDHGRGLTEIEAQQLSGPTQKMIRGGWDAEWVLQLLREKNIFGFDYQPERDDYLRIIVGYGTPEAAHIGFKFSQTWLFQRWQGLAEEMEQMDTDSPRWHQFRMALMNCYFPNPHEIRDIIHEGRVISTPSTIPNS